VLAALLRRRIGGYDLRGVGSTFARMLVASAIAAFAAWGASQLVAGVFRGFVGSLFQVAVGGTLGLMLAFGLGRLLRVAEVSWAVDTLKRVVRRRTGKAA